MLTAPLELARGAKGLIRMEGTQTILEPPEVTAGSRAIEKKPHVFSFGAYHHHHHLSLLADSCV